jgi:prepilin-type N-terminal cleavage/methylation domain-containing protein/prepilin-type processing-associated H-X9-DG protein
MRHAFSLVELLVVISIIALLIGILLPILSTARSTAVTVHCSAQIRNLSLGLSMYADDFRDRYPLAGGSLDFGDTDTGFGPYQATNLGPWMEQMFDYVSENQDILSGCEAYPVDTPYHYFLSTRAAFVDAGNARASVVRDRYRQPSAAVLGGDNNIRFDNEATGRFDADKDDYTNQCLVFLDEGQTYTGSNGNAWEPQHQGALNVMFVDGHIASVNAFDPEKMTYRYDGLAAY